MTHARRLCGLGQARSGRELDKQEFGFGGVGHQGRAIRVAWLLRGGLGLRRLVPTTCVLLLVGYDDSWGSILDP